MVSVCGQICEQCFWHQVNHKNGKCPNCGLLYKVNRVRVYYENKCKPNQLVAGAHKMTRFQSPQPTSLVSSGLGQGVPEAASSQALLG